MQDFSYDAAFDRNIGWLTEWEQQALRAKRVAIAGMGGVGGVHMLTLARFGVGNFSTADFDRFDIANFNRQIGANVATIGRPKAEVLDEMARAINPEIRVRRFDQGIDDSNIDAFLDGVDVFIDGFDFFVLDIRRKVFARCAELGIPALCAAPLGMGVGFLAFLPGKMSFEQYFRMDGQLETEQYLRFLVGLVPRGLHRAYLVVPDRIDLAKKRGPSTGASCQLCASVASIAAVKLMLGRGGVPAVPVHQHFDPYVGRLVTTTLRWGNAGPLQRLKLALGRRSIAKLAQRIPEPEPDLSRRTSLQEILNAARWAPSGDNSQPWRFEIIGEDSIVVHLGGQDRKQEQEHDQKQDQKNVYEYRDGEPTLLAGGALLESLRIAATAWGRRAEWRYVGSDDQAGPHRIAVDFVPTEAVEPDPLYAQLHLRSVNRRAYRTRKLTTFQKAALAEAAGPTLTVEWHESLAERWRMARLSGTATDIRLRIAEAFKVHQEVVDWDRAYSPDKMPSGTLGLAKSILPLMRWAMEDWSRMQRLNRWSGTGMSQLQLDYVPAIGSAAFFTMRLVSGQPAPESRVETLLGVGQAIQRFWLAATRLGLAMQPELAILAFAQYGFEDSAFTADLQARNKARSLAGRFRSTLGSNPEDIVFVGRIGVPRHRLPFARSTRLELSKLLLSNTPR